MALTRNALSSGGASGEIRAEEPLVPTIGVYPKRGWKTVKSSPYQIRRWEAIPLLSDQNPSSAFLTPGPYLSPIP